MKFLLELKLFEYRSSDYQEIEKPFTQIMYWTL